ncbi:hypothetical protein B0J18DRAFT_188342 [Chaetomium sp. MPI-SDFR-AT-0129]|nr:hypothetical protein B0J18DRAFT_188342 [Chaetomium sp. MPI-SDFR-AT-0129]
MRQPFTLAALKQMHRWMVLVFEVVLTTANDDVGGRRQAGTQGPGTWRCRGRMGKRALAGGWKMPVTGGCWGAQLETGPLLQVSCVKIIRTVSRSR